MNTNHKEYSLFIGRYQVPEPHEGHLKLLRAVLNEGKNICIGLRKEDGSDKNPYTLKERREAFEKIFSDEIKDGRVIIVELPDIIEVCYGRDVGWGIRQIHLDKETESISATKIRKNIK
jgi:nicotinamide mononucleotide adenylyltransferase